MKKKKNNIFTFIIVLIFLLVSNSINSYQKEYDKITKENSYNLIEKDNLLKIHYINVGQGDSIFIEISNNQTMLIDGAEAYFEKTIIDYIKNLGYNKIDYVIATHPHTDHIGGLSQIINTFDIDKIYMPKVVSTSKTYENLLKTIKDKGLKINTAKANVNIIDNNDLKIDIIAPNNESYSSLNNYSAVLKITYKDRSFLFMADAEKISENEITADIKADVIKVGHHGSNTSSSLEFIKRVNAKYAIISVGKNNYNHPNKEVIDRFKNMGTKIYRTDLNGTIIVSTDGYNINIKSEVENESNN